MKTNIINYNEDEKIQLKVTIMKRGASILKALMTLIFIAIIPISFNYGINSDITSIFIWVLVGLQILRNLLDILTYKMYFENEPNEPIYLEIIISVSLSIGLYLLFYYTEINLFSSILYADIGLIILISLFIARLIGNMLSYSRVKVKINAGYKSEYLEKIVKNYALYSSDSNGEDDEDIEEYLSYSAKMKMSLKAQRYSLTFLLAFIGILLMISGFYTPLEWYYQYLIPCIMFVPFIIVTIIDLTNPDYKEEIKKLNEGRIAEGKKPQSWLSIHGMWSALIEVIVMVVIFLLMMHVIWNLLGEIQDIGINNWVIISFVVSLGITMIVHIVISRDVRRSFQTSFSKNKDGNFPENEYLYQNFFWLVAILIVLLSVCLYYIGDYIILLSISPSFRIENTIGLIVTAIFFIVIMKAIESYYGRFYSKKYSTMPNKLPNYPNLIAIISLGVVIVVAIIMAFIPSTLMLNVFYLASLLIFLLMGYYVLYYPNQKEFAKEITKNASNKGYEPIPAIPLGVKADSVKTPKNTKKTSKDGNVEYKFIKEAE